MVTTERFICRRRSTPKGTADRSSAIAFGPCLNIDPYQLLELPRDPKPPELTRYRVRRRRPPSQGWKTLLRNHVGGIASLDLFVVRTISFKLLYGLVILRRARRRLVRVCGELLILGKSIFRHTHVQPSD